MGSIQRVLALYQEFVKDGESVELRLWSRGGKECFSFSQTLRTLHQILSRMRGERAEQKLKENETVPTSKEAPTVRAIQTLTNVVVSWMTTSSVVMSQMTPSSVVMSS